MEDAASAEIERSQVWQWDSTSTVSLSQEAAPGPSE